MNLSIKNISYAYESSTVLALDKVSAAFSRGWTGIVGDNGSGKSTLLSVLCGMITADSGEKIPNIRGIYCAQSTENPPFNMEEFAYDYSKEALRLRSLLHIDDEWFWRFDTLSHGERKRIQVACALFLGPNLIALDEPTNHLDSLTKYTLLKTLKDYHGIGIIVSHDRAFLDELIYQCIFMSAGKAKAIPGNYSEAKEQDDLAHKTQLSKRKAAREDLTRMQHEGHRRQAEAGRASERQSGKNLSKHDSDGREKLRLAIYSGQDGKTGLLSAQMDKKIEKAKERLESAYVEKRYDRPLELVTQKASRKVLFRMETSSITLSEDRNIIYPDLIIGNSDRIGLVGDNGAGKSRLIQRIMSRLLPDEKIIYIPQEVCGEERRYLLRRVKELPQEDLGRLLTIVARLNSPPERILSGDELSPGELRKLMLAEGLLREPYLNVMDEPTNHLDIHSIEALQAVLDLCKCTLILVSHDMHFLEQLSDIRWEFLPSQKSLEENEKCMEQSSALDPHGDVELKIVLT